MPDASRRYEQVSVNDDHNNDHGNENDDSATEVGSLMSVERGKEAWRDEEGQPSHKRGPMGKFRTFWSHHRWMLDTIMLVAILGLLVEKRLYSAPRHKYDLAADISGFAPQFSQKIVTFAPSPIYSPENASEFFSPATNQAWLDLVPKGLGYVNVTNPSNYNNLPHAPIRDYPDRTVYTTSVTHQLHCLHAIVEVYSGLSSGNMEKVTFDAPWHLNHCFDYLRQSIMCCGDVALEGAETSFPEGITGSDGWDATHVCRDYEQVYGYLEANRANDEMWI